MNLEKRKLYTAMSDEELDQELQSIPSGNPNMGYRCALGHVLCSGETSAGIFGTHQPSCCGTKVGTPTELPKKDSHYK